MAVISIFYLSVRQNCRRILNVNGFFLIEDFFLKNFDVENPLKFKFWSFSFQNYPKVRIFSSINLKVFQIRPRKSSFLDESWFRIFQKVTLKTNPFLLKNVISRICSNHNLRFYAKSNIRKKCKTLKLLASQLCCNLSSTLLMSFLKNSPCLFINKEKKVLNQKYTK